VRPLDGRQAGIVCLCSGMQGDTDSPRTRLRALGVGEGLPERDERPSSRAETVRCWLRCTLRRRVGRICAFYGVSLWRCVSSGAMGVLAGAGVCSSSSEWAGRRRAQQCDMQTHVLYCMVWVLARRLWCEVRLRGWVSRIEQSSLRAASHRQFPTLAGRALCGMLCFAVP
jgi:hypothetical protein